MIKAAACHWRLRTKLLLLIMGLAIFCVALFIGLWHQQNNVATLLERAGFIDFFDSEAFVARARELAPNYTVPPYYESDEGVNDPVVQAFQPYCDALVDEYTGVYVYGLDDGLYRGSAPAGIITRSWFNTIWTLEFKMFGEEIYEFPVEFANGPYLVHVFSYHRVLFAYPYLITCAILCIALFLGSVLFFLSRMTRRIGRVKDHIVQMAAGDLDTPIPACGNDEIGIVARELDALRCTLADNFQREREAQTANRDLITALSHDLRTPLTVLTGYLEVLKHTQQENSPYVDRCLRKADDIRLLTDHLFDAALVEKAAVPVVLQEVPLTTFTDCLRDNTDFLQTCGFQTDCRLTLSEGSLIADPTLLRRMLDNLFSNIIKYGDKHSAVIVACHQDAEGLRLTLQNHIKPSAPAQDSHHIGLQNVQRMVDQLGGTLQIQSDTAFFQVTLTLPSDKG